MKALVPVDLEEIFAEMVTLRILRQPVKSLSALITLKLDNISVLRILDEDAIAACRRRG